MESFPAQAGEVVLGESDRRRDINGSPKSSHCHAALPFFLAECCSDFKRGCVLGVDVDLESLPLGRRRPWTLERRWGGRPR